MTFDPNKAASLVAEAMVDEERMTAGPWRAEMGDFEKGGGHILCATPVTESWTKSPIAISHYFYGKDEADWTAIASMRNRNRAMAEQLAAACAEAASLRVALAEIRCQTIGVSGLAFEIIDRIIDSTLTKKAGRDEE